MTNNRRQKEIVEWERFEHHSVKEHMRLYDGHIAWHSSVIPENELYEAGVIHSFNKHRMNRIRMRNEGKPFHYRDYGMDFLAKSSSGTYHACQAKHYTTRKVTAKDIGSFFAILMGQIPNTGYLYTSGRIEINLKECIQNSNGKLVHHSLQFKAPCAERPIAEPVLSLRTYQEEAVAAALVPGKNVLDIACGLGKTLILGHVLKASSHSHVICVAPLRMSVQNLMDRIGAFLPTHRHFLVDSDAGGTTDPDAVRAALEDTSPMVLYTTVASFQEVVHPVASHSEYLIVDEVHNTVHSNKMCAAINVYENSLCMSATIPEELYEKVDATCVYKYNVASGIRNGYICDYEIVIPFLVTTADETPNTYVDVKTPTELEGEGDWIFRALFLATGMFLYGSKRCIVYLPTCEDCEAFKQAMLLVMERHHGSSLWCESITHALGASARSQRLDAFQNDSTCDKYVLLSVRILDEAVDLPKCDSEYITHIGDSTSDIRTVQRLLRGSRLDPANPSKKNHLFLWTDDRSKAVNALSLLKETDPTFHTKIHTTHVNYDKNEEKIQRQSNHTQMGELSTYMEVQCRTINERWEARRLHWVEQYERLGHPPKGVLKEIDFEQHRAAQWKNNMCNANKGVGTQRLTAEQKCRLTNTLGWLWDFDPFEKAYEHWVAQYERLGYPPKKVKKETDLNQWRAAEWQGRMRIANKGVGTQKITAEQRDLLTNTFGWQWKLPDAFEKSYKHWVAQYERLGHPPKHIEKHIDSEQRRASQWQTNMQSANKSVGSQRITTEQKDILTNTTGWRWKKPDAFEISYKHWVEQYKRLGFPPKEVKKDADLEQRRAALWQGNMRKAYMGKDRHKINTKQKHRLTNTLGWLWKEPDAFEEALKHWIAQYERLGHLPKFVKKIIDPEQHRAASWQSAMRSNFKRIGPKKPKQSNFTTEQKNRLTNTTGWLWKEPDAFEEALKHWIAQYERLGHSPKRVKKEIDPEQLRAASWQSQMRIALNHIRPIKSKRSKITDEQKIRLTNIPGWLWTSK
jgi:superfamily II DNA or RNA helicase